MSAGLFEQAAMPANTRRIYQSRFALFEAWCSERGIDPIPASPEMIQEYLATLDGEKKSVSTICLSRAAIAKAHVLRGHAPPSSEHLHGTLRTLRRRALPKGRICTTTLETILGACVEDALAARDRALLLTTYHGELRRGEAVGLDRDSVRRDHQGYRLAVPGRSGRRAFVRLNERPGSALCPVAALDAWLAQRDGWMEKKGPLFVALHPGGRRRDIILGQRLSPEDVDRVLKRRASDAGLDPLTVSAGELRVGRDTVIATRACHDNSPDNASRTREMACRVEEAKGPSIVPETE